MRRFSDAGVRNSNPLDLVREAVLMASKKIPADALASAQDTVQAEQRQKALMDEFRRRLGYVEQSYLFWKKCLGNSNDFNASLRGLKAALQAPADENATSDRLHPYLELLISGTARRSATGSPDSAARLTREQLMAGAREVSAKTSPVRGRPADPILRYHVEGLMALIEEMGGHPVRSVRYKDRHYEPQMSTTGGKVIEQFFKAVDPAVTRTALANVVRDARRNYDSKPRRFMGYFPFYGGSIDPETGLPVPGRGYRLDQLELAPPIYCP
jgi:hypothetical protein